MSLCINSNCPKPQNPDNILFCQACGSEVLLQQRYRVQCQLGRGGFGVTYEINEVRTNQAKVLKVLINNDPKAVELFKQEADVLSQLHHSGIPHVELDAYFEYYPYNSQNPIHCLVMEKVVGEDLEKYMQKRGLRPINQTTAIEWLKDLIIILEQVHNKDFFHRDIKPPNIMLRSESAELVLIDFGTVRKVTSTVFKQQGGVTGIISAGYTPSEQINHNAVPQSDFFALGRTFVYLLTGKEPLDPIMYDSYNETLNWRNHAPQISSMLADLLDDMMQRLYKYRPQNSHEILQRIAAIEKALKPQAPIPANNLKTFSFEVVTTDARGNITNQRKESAKYFTEDLGNGVTLEMVEIPGGTFIMGSPESEAQRRSNEGPQHQVTVPSFYMGKYELTQAQYQAIIGTNPSNFKGDNRPVERVSWNNAVEFCKKLSQKTGKNYRLPSEAEWEYACRAGTTTPFYFGESITPDLVNYNGNYTYASAQKGKYRQRTTDVGTFPPNSFGLYDMHGNVWEWCQDDYKNDYINAPTDGSALTSPSRSAKLLRGGSWSNDPGNCRSAYRSSISLDNNDLNIGFRVVCSGAART
ncbi:MULTISPECIES: bifunctional serine/threonine-protein kinase/formylglycine-generating enzyme family protein [unclassified Dolichospermum]|uniref:bifunctional serine/threonine-protein kinase/formylglycine-generating enzyme family protein n=1 Tax=unclassified Dolichospermum TaxID=2622029 RepID=UPI001448744F|nr:MULTISPECIES: bifunctional serine/threonine-protein kinase/formylglycine-generating enzyme family protein [unclassified Dolichospermum]MTJ18381.1 SUMF1/EgtB/PvdOfamily nonheme iron enzyme [Dolichospermum sp. UHCC 0299]MTJ38404.1 SUMF1/EgtB/PvdOfamily nonheme iron enzyme [Dolichospermum sp. UHCC 0406]